MRTTPILFPESDRWARFIEWAGPNRLIGWADLSDLEGLPLAEQLRLMRGWARAGFSARLRYTPLDTITNALTWQALRIPKARRGPATDDDREILEKARSCYEECGWGDVADDARVARAIKDAQTLPDDIPAEMRGDIAAAAFVYARMLRDDVRDTGDWGDANDAGHAYWLGTVLAQTGNPYRLAAILPPARARISSWPSRVADAREQRFLNNSLLKVDDDRQRILCPWHMPRWLTKATEGCFVMWAEAGPPQICRFWDYIDWPTLLKEHGDQLTITNVDSPSTATLDIVEDARSRGYTATADVCLSLSGFTFTGKPKFVIDCWGMQIDKALPLGEADRYIQQLRTAHRASDSFMEIDYAYKGFWVGGLEKGNEPLQALLAQAVERNEPRRKPVNGHSWNFS